MAAPAHSWSITAEDEAWLEKEVFGGRQGHPVTLQTLAGHLLSTASPSPALPACLPGPRVLRFSIGLTHQQRGQESVSFTQARQFLVRFGPRELALRKAGQSLFDADGQLFRWFHGAMERPDAETWVQQERPGAFLIRFSSSKPNFFSLTYKQDVAKVLHCLLCNCGKAGFALKNDRAYHTSIAAFVEANATSLLLPAPSALSATCAEEVAAEAQARPYGVFSPHDLGGLAAPPPASCDKPPLAAKSHYHHPSLVPLAQTPSPSPLPPSPESELPVELDQGHAHPHQPPPPATAVPQLRQLHSNSSVGSTVSSTESPVRLSADGYPAHSPDALTSPSSVPHVNTYGITMHWGSHSPSALSPRPGGKGSFASSELDDRPLPLLSPGGAQSSSAAPFGPTATPHGAAAAEAGVPMAQAEYLTGLGRLVDHGHMLALGGESQQQDQAMQFFSQVLSQLHGRQDPPALVLYCRALCAKGKLLHHMNRGEEARTLLDHCVAVLWQIQTLQGSAIRHADWLSAMTIARQVHQCLAALDWEAGYYAEAVGHWSEVIGCCTDDDQRKWSMDMFSGVLSDCRPHGCGGGGGGGPAAGSDGTALRQTAGGDIQLGDDVFSTTAAAEALDEAVKMIQQNRLDHAKQQLGRALRIVRLTGSGHDARLLEARALGNLGFVCAKQCDRDSAVVWYRQCLRLAGTKPRLDEVRKKVLNAVTLVCRDAQRFSDAQHFCEQHLAIASDRENVRILEKLLVDLRQLAASATSSPGL